MATSVGFTIRDQTQEDVYRPDGTRGKQWTVHLEHPGGVRSSITVPDEQYTAENVHALALEQAQRVAAVANLQHPQAGV